MEFSESLSKARSSSALLKYQKRKIVKHQHEGDNFMLSSCSSMLPINFIGGISDILKTNKIKKKGNNKKLYKKNDDLCSPVQTQKLRNINYQGANKSSTRFSHVQDSSRSYNQYTKEDTYSSCNISDASHSCEKVRKSICHEKSSSSIYYGTSNDNKKAKCGQPTSPKCIFKNSSNSLNDFERKSNVFKSIITTFMKKIENNSIIYSNEEIDIEHKQCLKLISKPNIIEDDMLRILVSTHNRVLFEATKQWKQICDEKQQKLDRILSYNRILEEKLLKLSLHTKELQKKMSKSRYLNSPKVESSVFNYEDEIICNNSKLEISEDQSSSAMLSVAQEISFENNTHNEEDQSKLNESSKDNYSISNEEPKAMNLKNYSMKHEVCFDKMKTHSKTKEISINDLSEKSQKFEFCSNLQSNMKKFGNYQIGRNQNMKETKSAVIFQLDFSNKVVSESESKSNTEDLEVSLSSSDYVNCTHPNKIQLQKRTNSDFCTPVGKCEDQQLLVRCASHHDLMNTITDSQATFERYLCNQNLKMQSQQLNERLKKYKDCQIDRKSIQPLSPSAEFEIKSNHTKYTIAEESAENRASTIAVTLPSKVHDFNKRMQSRLKECQESSLDKAKCKFEIENGLRTQSALDIFKTHYHKNIKQY